jgi:hypothetical protein
MDGPTHYLSNGETNGSTYFKQRLLKRGGYRVHNIKITALQCRSLEEKTLYAAALAKHVKTT